MDILSVAMPIAHDVDIGLQALDRARARRVSKVNVVSYKHVRRDGEQARSAEQCFYDNLARLNSGDNLGGIVDVRG